MRDKDYATYICYHCGNRAIHLWGDYLTAYGKKVCINCIRDAIEADGKLVLDRQGDTVKVSVVFDEPLFVSVYDNTCIMDFLSKLNYGTAIIDYDKRSVTLRYEPPVIRKLMDRGELEDLVYTSRYWVKRTVEIRMRDPAIYGKLPVIR